MGSWTGTDLSGDGYHNFGVGLLSPTEVQIYVDNHGQTAPPWKFPDVSGDRFPYKIAHVGLVGFGFGSPEEAHTDGFVMGWWHWLDFDREDIPVQLPAGWITSVVWHMQAGATIATLTVFW